MAKFKTSKNIGEIENLLRISAKQKENEKKNPIKFHALEY